LEVAVKKQHIEKIVAFSDAFLSRVATLENSRRIEADRGLTFFHLIEHIFFSLLDIDKKKFPTQKSIC
jgi:hypothetical protein